MSLISPYLNPSAVKVWADSLDQQDRILITGASGWFGQTAVNLMHGLEQPIFLLASTEKTVRSLEESYTVTTWDEGAIKDFEPTVVIDCAFLTREIIKLRGFSNFVSSNEKLISNLIWLTKLESVQRVITISSGAAIYPDDAIQQPIEMNPYGYLKRKSEIELRKISLEKRISSVVARAWSVSGAFVGKPMNFAMADMIIQAKNGHIHVSANSRVERRYSGVDDLLALSLAKSKTTDFYTLNSEGPLVEIGELAEIIVRIINPSATISRSQFQNDLTNDYWSKSEDWQQLCADYHLLPAGLEDQIMRTYNGLVRMGFV